MDDQEPRRAAPERGDDHRSHLERSRRIWDRWSRFYELNDRDTEPIRRRAVEALELDGDETVLDVGCGPGSNFELLRERLGPAGRIIGVDYSPEMVAKARSRVETNDWDGIEVIRADATRPVVRPSSVDAVVATLSISAMPDVTAAVGRIHEALRPGCPVAVYGIRLVPAGPLRAINPVLALGYRYLANRKPGADVLGVLFTAFEDVEVLETYLAGTNYVAAGRKPAV